MPHDVGFYDAHTRDNVAFYFGYAEGIFYRAFDAEHLNAGISGADASVTRTAQEVRTAIATIQASPVYQTEPDAESLSIAVGALENWLQRNPDGELMVHYS